MKISGKINFVSLECLNFSDTHNLQKQSNKFLQAMGLGVI